jgi:VanZ family protein
MRAIATKVVRWLPAILWATVIYSLSATQGSDLPSGPAWLAHLIEYTILGAAVSWAIGASLGATWRIVATVALCSAFGMSDEFHQSFVPTRTPDPMDWAMDTTGALAGAVFVALVVRRLKPDRRI